MEDTSFGICAVEAILTLNTGGERFVACDKAPYCYVRSLDSDEQPTAGE
jgi:hypothetical protein